MVVGLKLCIHLQTLCPQTHLRTCSENLFFYKLPANQRKLTNQPRTTGSCMKIVGNRKIFLRTWKRTKIEVGHCTHWATNILCVHQKNDWRWFATNCSRTPYTDPWNTTECRAFIQKMQHISCIMLLLLSSSCAAHTADRCAQLEALSITRGVPCPVYLCVGYICQLVLSKT